MEKDDITSMMAALYETGALYVSANVHSGWALKPKANTKAFQSTAQLPVIKWNAKQHRQPPAKARPR